MALGPPRAERAEPAGSAAPTTGPGAPRAPASVEPRRGRSLGGAGPGAAGGPGSCAGGGEAGREPRRGGPASSQPRGAGHPWGWPLWAPLAPSWPVGLRSSRRGAGALHQRAGLRGPEKPEPSSLPRASHLNRLNRPSCSSLLCNPSLKAGSWEATRKIVLNHK